MKRLHLDGFTLTLWLGAAVLWMVAFSLVAGCANTMQGFQSSLTATATIVTSGYRAADQYDAEKQPTLKTVDEFSAYKAKRDLAMKSLETGADAVKSGYVALQASDAAKRKDWGSLTVKVIAIGIQISDALKAWGVTLPGGL